jgi:glycolate oxidase iron-sulfur subunit
VNAEPPFGPGLANTPLGRAAAGLDSCVHCGFCLQACPTYLAHEDENDSPRGRLLLMRGALEGELSLTDAAVATHMDRCLGCRACETACPAGVPFGHLLEATRATQLMTRPLPVVARLMLRTFAAPWLRRPVLWMARLLRATRLADLAARLPGRPGFAGAMLASTRPPRSTRWRASGSGARGTCALLRGCVMDGLFAHTHAATERTLTMNDYRMVAAGGQHCCGALHAHAGRSDEARRLARLNIAAFERSGAAWVVVNAAGCGSMLKEYGALLAEDPQWHARAERFSARVRDVSELLAAVGPRRGGPLQLTVTYDAPCHLHHAQHVTAAPLTLLAAIPGLTLVPLPDADRCCGSAGIYNLIEPETARAVLEPKLAHIAATGAPVVATGNPGCHMQIGGGARQRGLALRVCHPVDLLDASYAALGRPGPTS